jgi:hypothetical protein
MIESESPGAVAALGASVSDQLGRRVIAEDSSHQTFTQAPIRAKLDGSDRCEAVGISVRGYSPVLDLCRQLLDAGYDPASPLEAWRGKTLCLRVSAIGEAARLTVADDRHGTPRLRHQRERSLGYAAGSPVAQTGSGGGWPLPLPQGQAAGRAMTAHLPSAKHGSSDRRRGRTCELFWTP